MSELFFRDLPIKGKRYSEMKGEGRVRRNGMVEAEPGIVSYNPEGNRKSKSLGHILNLQLLWMYTDDEMDYNNNWELKFLALVKNNVYVIMFPMHIRFFTDESEIAVPNCIQFDDFNRYQRDSMDKKRNHVPSFATLQTFCHTLIFPRKSTRRIFSKTSLITLLY